MADSPIACDREIELLERAGRRLTAKWHLVLDILIEHDRIPLTIDEIFSYAKSASFAISLPTVYRAIDYLDGVRVVLKLRLDDRGFRYMLAPPPGVPDYPRLVCERCGRIIDVADSECIQSLIDAKERLRLRYGFAFDRTAPVCCGLCAACCAQSQAPSQSPASRRSLLGGLSRSDIEPLPGDG